MKEKKGKEEARGRKGRGGGRGMKSKKRRKGRKKMKREDQMMRKGEREPLAAADGIEFPPHKR